MIPGRYDRTLATDTIRAILSDLQKSPEIDKPNTYEHRRATQLLHELKKRKSNLR